MITRQIAINNLDNQIRSLYETAFPVDEQIPWDDLVRLVWEMPLDFTAYYDGQDFIGFTILYPRKLFNWFWYFAVRDDLRGQGYGQQILTTVMDRYSGESIVLDMEAIEQRESSTLHRCSGCDRDQYSQNITQVDESLDIRKRRHDFYLRNGFKDTNVYRTYNDITMTIMMMGEGTFTLNDWDELIHELQQFWLPDDIKE